MTRMVWWMVDELSRTLVPDERDAVRGDLAEAGATCGQALREVLGLVVRRQAALWRHWRPWLALLGLALPLGWLLSVHSVRMSDHSSIYLWIYANNWDWSLLSVAGFRLELVESFKGVLLSCLMLACWAWVGGIALGWFSRRAAPATGSLFCLILPMGLLAASGTLGHALAVNRGRDFPNNAPVFHLVFYRVLFPVIVQVALVMFPAIAGMRRGLQWAGIGVRSRVLLWMLVMFSFASMTSTVWSPWLFRYRDVQSAWWPLRLIQFLGLSLYWPAAYRGAVAVRRLCRGRTVRTAALLTVLAGMAVAADPATVRAPLQPAGGRKPAPEIKLKDGSGKTVTLKKYRGKVVLLDFWATWCHGCKEEIPWFAEFQRKYGVKGLRVVGVSLDDDGWKAIEPFLQTADVPYRIVLGDQPTAQKYGIENMPDTFLIDRHGRIAAAYTGVVDRDDVEANLRAILGQR